MDQRPDLVFAALSDERITFIGGEFEMLVDDQTLRQKLENIKHFYLKDARAEEHLVFKVSFKFGRLIHENVSPLDPDRTA